MPILTRLILSFGLLGVVLQAQPQNEKGRRKQWQPAKYQNLVMGQSTRTEMLKSFGKPKYVDSPEGQRKNDPDYEDWNTYDAKGNIQGKLVIVTRKKTAKVMAVYLYPDKLTYEEAIKHLGQDYFVTRYDFCKWLDDEDSAPIYEDQDGDVINYEYRSRGIAFSVNHEGNVNEIMYVSQPIGHVNEKECELELRRYKQKRNSSIRRKNSVHSFSLLLAQT